MTYRWMVNSELTRLLRSLCLQRNLFNLVKMNSLLAEQTDYMKTTAPVSSTELGPVLKV